MFNRLNSRLKNPSPASIFFIITLGMLSSFVAAADQTLPDFKAEFSVQFLGFSLGTAYQSFHCQQTQCILTSQAKPEGLVARFVNEATVETIKVQQNHFRWLSYHKTLTRHKSGKIIIKNMDLVREDNRVIYLQSGPNHPKQWPASDNVYDTISLAYAIAYRLSNHQPIMPLLLQDEKGQYPLKLLANEKDRIELPWLDDEVNARYLKLDSTQATIRLWIVENGVLPKPFQAFPATIEVYNKQTHKTVELNLQSPPH